MLTASLYSVIGLVLLFVGGEGLVRGAVALAARLGIPPLIIGLTVVGAGTSAPELIVSLGAALDGSSGIAMGNVVGSNIANILLIMGLGAMVHPLRTSKAIVFRDGGTTLVATIVLARMAMSGTIERWMGAVLLVGLLAYLGLCYWWEARQARTAIHAKEARELEVPALPLIPALGALVLGIAALVLGADLLVDGAVTIATAAGVPEVVIGLTLVAVGTSLPELATTIIAALRRHTDVAVGNAIGSCTFNILGIVGITGLVTPIPVDPQILSLDIWVLLFVAAGSLPLLASGWVLRRWEGGLFLGLYAAYMGLLFVGMG